MEVICESRNVEAGFGAVLSSKKGIGEVDDELTDIRDKGFREPGKVIIRHNSELSTGADDKVERQRVDCRPRELRQLAKKLIVKESSGIYRLNRQKTGSNN